MRLRWGTAGLCCVVMLLACAAPARAQLLEELLTPRPPSPSGAAYENPVLTGDYPDPSVIRTEDGYWAAVTSGGWRPPYTILHSADLVNWHVAGSVLRRRPAWAKGDFWAPEITRLGPRFLVYYAARSRGGRFCVGAASASRPVGRYRDHGPVVCTPMGAIDPLPVRDEGGRLHLVWKEEGNPRRAPTQIMAAPLSRDGLRLAGPARELFRNDRPWEGRVVEGPSLTRHQGRLYLLYSARSCCGPDCEYATGVARSRRLYGRWEKHPGPIVAGNHRFRCPGHGSVVDGTRGRQFFVYHAYSAWEPRMVGRQLLLDRLEWGKDGWPQLNDGHGPSRYAISPLRTRQLPRRPPATDEFTGRYLSPAWQWPDDGPRLRLDRRRRGRLVLGTVRAGRRRAEPGVVGRQPAAANYAAEAVLGWRQKGARSGLAIYSARRAAVGIELRRDRYVLWRTANGRYRRLATMRAPSGVPKAVRVGAVAGRWFTFQVLTPRGWRTAGAGGYSPPFWLGAPRIVLRVSGPRKARAAFERFRMEASN